MHQTFYAKNRGVRYNYQTAPKLYQNPSLSTGFSKKNRWCILLALYALLGGRKSLDHREGQTYYHVPLGANLLG